MIGRSEIQRAFESMHKRLVVFFALALVGCRSLPDAESEDPRLNRLRTRVAATLVAVGGPYE